MFCRKIGAQHHWISNPTTINRHVWRWAIPAHLGFSQLGMVFLASYEFYLDCFDIKWPWQSVDDIYSNFLEYTSEFQQTTCNYVGQCHFYTTLTTEIRFWNGRWVMDVPWDILGSLEVPFCEPPPPSTCCCHTYCLWHCEKHLSSKSAGTPLSSHAPSPPQTKTLPKRRGFCSLGSCQAAASSPHFILIAICSLLRFGLSGMSHTALQQK